MQASTPTCSGPAIASACSTSCGSKVGTKTSSTSKLSETWEKGREKDKNAKSSQAQRYEEIEGDAVNNVVNPKTKHPCYSIQVGKPLMEIL